VSKLAIKTIARSFEMHLQQLSFGFGFNYVTYFLIFFFFGVSFKAGMSFKKSI
jgi:hypothetical protein